MPKIVTLEQFIEMVESNQHDLVIEKFYAIDGSTQENQSETRIGRIFLV